MNSNCYLAFEYQELIEKNGRNQLSSEKEGEVPIKPNLNLAQFRGQAAHMRVCVDEYPYS